MFVLFLAEVPPPPRELPDPELRKKVWLIASPQVPPKRLWEFHNSQEATRMRLVNVRMSKHTRTIITVDEDEEEEDESLEDG